MAAVRVLQVQQINIARTCFRWDIHATCTADSVYTLSVYYKAINRDKMFQYMCTIGTVHLIRVRILYCIHNISELPAAILIQAVTVMSCSCF